MRHLARDTEVVSCKGGNGYEEKKGVQKPANPCQARVCSVFKDLFGF